MTSRREFTYVFVFSYEVTPQMANASVSVTEKSPKLERCPCQLSSNLTIHLSCCQT